MSKSFCQVALIFVILPTLSCSNVDSQQFETKLGNNQLILLDTSGRSCKLQINGPQSGADDVSPIKAILGKVKIHWEGLNPLKLVYMRVKFQTPAINGGVKSYFFSGKDLAFIWSGTESLPIVVPASVKKRDVAYLVVHAARLCATVLTCAVTSSGCTRRAQLVCHCQVEC